MLDARLRTTLGVILSTLTVAASAAYASPAQAQSMYGCDWPYVCLKDGLNNKTGPNVARYKAVTSGWQTITERRNFSVVNTRDDDVVYFRYRSGRTYCQKPNSFDGVYGVSEPVNGIRIDSSSTC